VARRALYNLDWIWQREQLGPLPHRVPAARWALPRKMSMLDSMKSSERLERCRRYGFDCADSLEWRGWEPGGEYTMRLSLQNVGKKMQTIKYKLPTTKFFGMEFPTVVKVSPGMSYDVDVVFRPIVAEEYDDCVEFTTVFGVFSIPVRATLLKKSFSAPDSFEFGFCPTMEISEGAFEVRLPPLALRLHPRVLISRQPC
jgi:hypothetical protein